MLSLILASFVLTIVGMAIDFHLRVLDSGRTKIEEGQLAKAILQRMADDLRNSVVYRPPEVASQLAGAVDGAEGILDAGTVAEVESYQSSTDLGAVGTIPGVYGESDWLQIDVMRMPRIDEYNFGYDTTQTDVSETGDVLSAVKTVLYFLETREETRVLEADGSFKYDGGLMRRELDRAATLWAEQQGMLTQMNQDLEPLAVEVSDLSFEYYDGLEFLDYWDTEEKTGLPKAVLISIAIKPVESDTEFATVWSSSASGSEAEEEPSVYRLLVTLPISEPYETQDDTATDETSGGTTQ